MKKINIPVLFVCGEFDEATPETVKKYHKLVKGSKFQIVKNASHCISLEKPKELLKVVKEFIE